MSTTAELVTGHSGTAHISSVDMARLNYAIFGREMANLDVINGGVSIDLQTNGDVTLSPGDLVWQGRHIILPHTQTFVYDDPVPAGYYRYDSLIVEYNCTGGIEDVEIKLLKGGVSNTEEGAETKAPVITPGDMFVLQKAQLQLASVARRVNAGKDILANRLESPSNLLDMAAAMIEDKYVIRPGKSIQFDGLRLDGLVTSGKANFEVCIPITRPVREDVSSVSVVQSLVEAVVVQNGKYIYGIYSNGFQYMEMQVYNITFVVNSKGMVKLVLQFRWENSLYADKDGTTNNDVASILINRLTLRFE